MAKLNAIVNGGSEFAPANKNNFISWVMPGMPFGPEDFTFLAKGFNGKDADETRDLVMKAADMALFTDLVPDPTAVINRQDNQTIDRNSQESLSKIYGNILQFAKVTNLEPSAAEKAKLEKFHNLLYQTKTEKDIITDEEKTSVVETPLKQAYLEKQQAYEDAALLYNLKAVNAATGDNKTDVIDFGKNAPIYRNKVKSAMNAWTTAGHKNDVESIEAYIAQVTGRSMATWFAGLRDIYERASFTDSMIDFTFHPVRLFPANFFNQSWMNFSFSENEVTTHKDSANSSWSAGAKAGFGFWSAKAGASGSSARQNASLASSSFKMSFEFTQVKILRPWFGTELFSCRGWKLDPGTWTFGNPQLSTGGDKPAGNFIAYSTNMLFVKNLKIEFDKAAWQSSGAQSQFAASTSAGWGPFSLKGGYSHSDTKQDFHSTDNGQGITAPGMQLIGFVNRLVGICPNPDPNAKFD
ncbi:MAG: hypothetical protein WKG07_49025 [Hymenobacter sp.]